ncbi:MAG: prolipoprotein diacylglyceryl transferase, partial [Alphaproteobacteria bacterium]|nr:prolipoprotein diacylglyceryl transferase [Alphaproteobacteria bacterium]
MLPALPFPAIDPVAIAIGPLVVRWYALAYIAGLVGGWRYALWLARRPPALVPRERLDDFVFWATLAVLLGGRLGYVLFYKPGYYISHPGEILMVWHGGMSFHGGLVGVIVACIWFARRHGIPVLAFGDVIAAVAPIGLLCGRLANFINGELFGRVSDVPWAMVFPTGGPQPRHPSQLYEAALEGLGPLVILFVLVKATDALRRPGLLLGALLLGYGLARSFVEFFREPDVYLGFLFAGATMGQLLSLPMIIGGLALVGRARRRA